MDLCNRILLSLLAAMFLSSCASTKETPPDASNLLRNDTNLSLAAIPANRTGSINETTEILLAAPPANWHQIYQLNEKVVRLADFVPEGETNLDWQTKLSFESHSDLVELDPIEILLSEAKKSEEKCSFIQHFNIFSGYENNYPTSLRLIMCGENENLKRGELSMLKVIQGDDFLYIVRFLKRIKPFEINQPDVEESEIATWSDYLRKISLCNSTDEDHPC